MKCPYCSQPIKMDVPMERLPHVLRLAPQERQLLERLIRANGRPVPKDALIYSLWLARGCDEPDSANNIVHKYVHYLRKALRLHGWQIVCEWKTGYSLRPLAKGHM